MKTFKLILGIILVIISGCCILEFLPELIKGNQTSNYLSYNIYSFTVLICGILLITNTNKEEQEAFKHYKMIKAEEEKVLYRYKDYKCKDSSFYMMNNKERLNYYYDNLPSKEQKKLFEYAERVYRKLEDEKYLKK